MQPPIQGLGCYRTLRLARSVPLYSTLLAMTSQAWLSQPTITAAITASRSTPVVAARAAPVCTQPIAKAIAMIRECVTCYTTGIIAPAAGMLATRPPLGSAASASATAVARSAAGVSSMARTRLGAISDTRRTFSRAASRAMR